MCAHERTTKPPPLRAAQSFTIGQVSYAGESLMVRSAVRFTPESIDQHAVRAKVS